MEEKAGGNIDVKIFGTRCPQMSFLREYSVLHFFICSLNSHYLSVPATSYMYC